MSVTPVPAGSFGGVSVYEGLSASNSVLAPSGSVPAGAGMPWEDEPAPVPSTQCQAPRGITGCLLTQARDSQFWIGHTRSFVKAVGLVFAP